MEIFQYNYFYFLNLLEKNFLVNFNKIKIIYAVIFLTYSNFCHKNFKRTELISY